MQRRTFMKLSLGVAGAAVLTPEYAIAKTLDLNAIEFSKETYDENNAQTIIIFTYGGACQLGGNLTNLEEIDEKSQSGYNYFGTITKTTNNCWAEAGGRAMETMIENGDLTIFRSCYSAHRDITYNRAHGDCTEENQKGTFDHYSGGILSNLAMILEDQGCINDETIMPFVTMEGESHFYDKGDYILPGFAKPVSINESFSNPYYRRVRIWYNYTRDERKENNYSRSDADGGFDPILSINMDKLAQETNEAGKVKDYFTKRPELDNFLVSIANSETPDLGDDAYPRNDFARKIEAAIKLLDKNPDTKVITLGTGGLGGWDDHNDAKNYTYRMERLFEALQSGMAHLKAIGKDENINIMVFGEFGRNVNLNTAFGWDHGNLQNLYVMGGKGYFKHQGIVGETIVDQTGVFNRLWLKPKEGTYWFEPLSIAATLYKIYGVENPEIMTDNYPAIDPLFE